MHVLSLVGYTASNKSIYQYDHEDSNELTDKLAEFSQEDHFDAVAVFSYLQLIYWRTCGGKSRDFKSASSMLMQHELMISSGFRKQNALKLGIVTAFDLSQYGRKHCVPYLQEVLST